MPSPACEVKNGGAAYVATTNGVNVTPSNTIIIRLIDSSADSWQIDCVYTDEMSSAATVTAALAIDPVLRTATFTAPAAGRTYIFRSRVNQGIGPDSRVKPSYATTFGVYTLTAEGNRVIAAGETTEGSSSFGYAASINTVIRNGGAGAAVADDIAKSAGTNIDRVRGLRSIPLSGSDGAPSTIGATWTYNAVGTSSYKAKKPAPVGHFDPHDYGTIDRTGVVACDAVFAAMLADINNGLTTNYLSAVVQFGERSIYYFADNLILDQSVRLVGVSGGSSATDGSTVLKFAPGKGILFRARGNDAPRGSGGMVRDVECIFQLIPGIMSYAHNTAYADGDLMQFGHDRELLWECVVAGTTATALTASGADSVWVANTDYSLNDVVVPTASKQNGHKYRCVTAGRSHATTEPNIALFGGWDWRSASLITDGSVVWEEDGIYQPHHDYSTPRPFTAADSNEVCWTASKEYHHNAVVRVVGAGEEFTKWLWNVSGVKGTSGGSAPSLAGAIGSTVVDGTITWTIIDPIAQGLLLVDGTAKFFPRNHPGISIRAPGVRIDGCRLGGSTNDLIHVYGAGGAPTSNANFPRISSCTFLSSGNGASGGQGGGGCLHIRGSDANGGSIRDCDTGGAFPITQALGVEALHGGRDVSFAGSSWHGCGWNEALLGYSYDFANSTATNSVYGGYVEGGTGRFSSGTFVGSMEGSANGPLSWTRDSVPCAPRYGRGVYGEALHPSGSQTIECSLAGRSARNANDHGLYAWAIQAITAGSTGEGQPTQLTWKISGWSTGYWGLAFGPATYGGVFTTYYFSGDLAPSARDFTGSNGVVGQFGVPRKRLFFGPPTSGSQAEGCLAWGSLNPTYPGEPGEGIWTLGDHQVDPTLIAQQGYTRRVVVTAGDYAGTPPKWEYDGFVDPSCRARKIAFVTDGTTGANQVIDAGSAMDFPADSMMEIEVRIAFKVDGEANAGSALLAGTFYRNGSADPVRVGTDDNPGPKLTAGLAGTTVDLNINTTTDKIEVRMTPGAAKVIKGNIIRVQTRRVG